MPSREPFNNNMRCDLNLFNWGDFWFPEYTDDLVSEFTSQPGLFVKLTFFAIKLQLSSDIMTVFLTWCDCFMEINLVKRSQPFRQIIHRLFTVPRYRRFLKCLLTQSCWKLITMQLQVFTESSSSENCEKMRKHCLAKTAFHFQIIYQYNQRCHETLSRNMRN